MARITQADLDSLRMPPDALGNPGLQDIEALKAASWGTDYDVDARRRAIEEARNRITAALVAQQVPVQVAQQIAEAQTSGGGQRGGDVSQGLSGQTSSGATSFGSSGNTGPGGAQGFGGSAAPGSDFMGGAPAGPSMFGTGDRAFDPGGAMTTANASMVGDPLGGAQSVSVFGRGGDDTSQQSQDKQASDRAAITEAVGNRSSPDVPGNFAGRGGPGREGYGEVDLDAVAASAPSLPSSGRGKGDFGDFSEESDVLAEGATSTMGGKGSTLAMGIPGWGAAVPGSAINALGQVVDMGKTALGRGWGAVVPDAPIAPADRAPAVATPGRQPTGSPVTFAGNPPGAPPGAPADPGGGAVAPGGGFGPGADQAVGGYTSGFASTEGFGGGYSGSASMGNTQGATGFTAGAPGGSFSSGATPGFSAASTGAFTAGFQAGFDTAAAAMTSDPGAMGFGGSDPGGGGGAGQGSGESGAGTGGAGDTAGGSAGSGVG